MPYPNEHACRVRDPDDFRPDSFRRTERDHEGKKYSVIMGKLKGQDTMTDQAYRYPKDTWSETQARSHCQDHNGSFEAASDDAEDCIECGRVTRDWYSMVVNDDVAEISIFDQIGGWSGMTAKDFKADFDRVKGRPSIHLLLNCPGGDVPDGMAVYNLLAGVRDRLTIKVMGIAASMGSVIALAGRELVMAEGTYFMIHEPAWFCLGTAEDMEKTRNVLIKIREEMANIYEAHSALTREEILEKMKAETWFTAAEAEEAGFVTRLEEPEKAVALALDRTRFPYRHIPQQIRAFDAAHGDREEHQAHGDLETSSEEGQMQTLTAVMAALVALSAEELQKATAEDKAKVADLFGFKADLETARKETEAAKAGEGAAKKQAELETGKVALLTGENAALAKRNAELEEAAIKAMFDGLVAKGLLTPKTRAQWEDQYRKDPDGTRKLLAAKGKEWDPTVYGSGDPGPDPKPPADGDIEDPAVVAALKAHFGWSDEEVAAFIAREKAKKE